MSRIRIVGFGAPGCGDDEAGLLAAERLRAILPQNVEIRCETDGGANLYDWARDVDVLILIDAARSTEEFALGQFLHLRYPQDRLRLAQTPPFHTHQWGLDSALALAETMHWLPQEVHLFLLAGDNFKPGTPLSPKLFQSIPQLTQSVQKIVSRIGLAGR